MSRSAGLTAAAALSLVLPLLVTVPARAAPGGSTAAGPDRTSVPVGKAAVKARSKAPSESATTTSLPAAAWPAAGSATVDLSAAAARSSTGVALAAADAAPGGLPVRVAWAVPAENAPRTRKELSSDASGPTAVRVSVVDRRTAEAVGARGVVFTLTRGDGLAGRAPFAISVGYAGFATAYGGDYGSRLRLVSLPDCALTTPDVPACQVQTPVASTNNEAAKTVSANQVAVGTAASATSVMALTAGSSSGGADWSATDLSPTYAWAAGSQGGEFTLNYPMQAPPSLGGPAPDVSLLYSSGSVDGKTWAKGGQTSLVGEGWDLQAGGYIERTFRTCADDGSTGGDMCWIAGGAVTMVFNGRSTKLVQDAGGWHASSDDGLKVEPLTESTAGMGNGARNGEYWKITALDGTQYYFGKHKRYVGDTAATNSTLTEPVISNNAGEPCNGQPGQWCYEAYRWNLDYVMDPRGNTLTYFYSKYQGKYGFKNNASAQVYDLSATLDRIEYGTRAGSEASAPAPMQVVFTNIDRCFGTCSWPSTFADTPTDQYCDTSVTTCPDVLAPMHFSRKRLSAVTTQVRSGSTYRSVDKWDLEQTFLTSGDSITPAGDDTAPNLWMSGLTHTGYAQDGVTTQAEPKVLFGGTRMANRVDWGDNIGVASYMHFRITQVDNGVGGQTTITYSPVECANQAPKQNGDANPYKCFPVYFSPQQALAGWGWFNKFVATSVTETDLTGGSPAETVSYAYSNEGSNDSSLWAHDDVDTAAATYTSWADWRGYSAVTTTHGTVAGQQTVSKTLYHRGLLGDAKKSGDDTQVLYDQRQAFALEPLQAASATPVALAGGSNGKSLCLDIANWGTGNGTPIQSYPCTGDWNQVWQRQTDGTNALKNPQSGKCLDVTGNGTANGVLIQLWQCQGTPNQAWLRQPDGSIKNVGSGRCLDLKDYYTLPNGQIQIFDCNGGYFNQNWMPTTAGGLQAAQATRCADATGGGTANGTTIQNWYCAANDNQFNQVWQLQGDGTVKNPTAGRCLTINASGTANGTTVYLWDCTAAAKQIWQPQADGSLKNPSTGRCLDSGGFSAPHNVLFIYDCNGNLSQQWVGRIPDKAALRGMPRAEFVVSGGTTVGATLHTYSVTQTGSRAAFVTPAATVRAFMTRETQIKGGIQLPVQGGWRWTQNDTTYDSYGLVVDVADRGDVTVGSDDFCSHTDYARNTAAYYIDYPSKTVTTDCAGTLTDASYLSGSRTFYDGSTTLGAPPTQFLSSKTESLASVSGGSQTWEQASKAEYDSYGRTTALYDALDNKTSTAYTPATGAPITSLAVTNPKGWVSTSTVDPGRASVLTETDVNNKVSTGQYDPLGRLTKAWLNNRPTSSTPDKQFVYTTSATAPTTVQMMTLGPNGNQISAFSIYDGRLRLRQTQAPAPVANGGRMISDTVYDGRGLTARSSTFWNNASTPSGTLATFADTDVPVQARYTYDDLGRTTVDALYNFNIQKSQRTYNYQGDRATVTPPPGGTTTQTLFDARGKVIELRHFATYDTSGPYTKTTYTYDRTGQLVGAKDPEGNQWSRTIDLRGRLTGQSDPDGGTSSYTYDKAGNRLTSTDGQGVTLAYTYDSLNRRTGMWNGSTSAPGYILASWDYDAIVKDQLSSSTRYTPTGNFVETATGFDDAYRRLGTTVTVPAGEGGLTGTWTMSATFNVDGSPATITYPAAAGLAAETVTYTHDANGYQLTAAGLDTYVSASTFQPWGGLYQMTLGTGSKRVRITTDTWQYNRKTKSIAVATENQTTPNTFDDKLFQAYNWDLAGKLTSIDTKSGGATTDSQCFTYDALMQLANAWTTTPALGGCTSTAPTTATVGGPDAYWNSYTYDNAGNRKTEVKHGLSGASDLTSTYAYPAVGGKAHAVSSVTTSAGGSKAFLYDGAGQTTKVTTNGVATDLVWEDFGKLRSTTVHATGGDQTTSYVYDAGGSEVMQKTATSRTLYLGGTEVKADGSGTVTGVVRSYIVNGAVVATRTNPGGLNWQAGDHQGTAAVVIDAATLQTGIRKQDPFGNSRGAAISWPDSRGFVGGKVEPTGLVQMGARVYDPSIGRFLSPDHLLNIANAEQANGYVYADNNPTTLSDPTGLERGTAGHDTAVALRMAALQTRFPGALMYGVSEGGNGADLVCWGCDPGKVWVWEFKSFDQSTDVGEDSLAKGIKSAKASALTGDMPVVAGPDFGPLMGLPVQTGNSIASDRRLVTVSDSGTRGVQVYWTNEQDKQQKQAEENKRKTEWARAVADEHNERAEKAGHIQPGGSHGSRGPKPTNNPPKPPAPAGHSTNHSTNSPGLGRQQRPSDGVRGGSFWGDVALFAGVIFAIELAIYGAAQAAAAIAAAAAAARAARAAAAAAEAAAAAARAARAFCRSQLALCA